ncbi:MAG: DUF6588 family protein, partial [Bacteroidota bacterium]
KLMAVLLICTAGSSFAQIDFSSFLEGGVDDANTLLENYLEPAFVGFGYGINSGWYNTAKPHKLLGFDITVTGTAAMVPSDAEFFTINDNDYENISLNANSRAAGNDQAPTLFGPNLGADDLPLLDYRSDGGQSISISAPTGLGIDESIPFNAVPSAMVQLGIGLVKNTDLKVRFVPTIESEGEYEFSLFGLGVVHDLKQWIPGFKQLPIDISGFVGWNRLNTKIFLDEQSPDQVAEFSTNGFSVQGLVSKTLPVLTVFAGVGFATTTTNFDLLGTYETDAGTFTDPSSFAFSSSGPRANIGARIKLLILTLHVDYALQKYNTLTVGAGLSIR